MFFLLLEILKIGLKRLVPVSNLINLTCVLLIKLLLFVCIIFFSIIIIIVTLFKKKFLKINTLEKEINGEVVRLSGRGSPRLQESGG